MSKIFNICYIQVFVAILAISVPGLTETFLFSHFWKVFYQFYFYSEISIGIYLQLLIIFQDRGVEAKDCKFLPPRD